MRFRILLTPLTLGLCLWAFGAACGGDDELPHPSPGGEPTEGRGQDEPAAAVGAGDDEPAAVEAESADDPAAPSKAVSAIGEALRALSEGDIEGALSHFDEDAGWQTFGDRELELTGRGEIGALLRGARDSFPDLRVRAYRIIDGDSVVAVEAVVDGTHKGAWRGIEATGSAVEVPILLIFRLEQGDLVHLTLYANETTLLQQIGHAAGTPAEIPWVPAVPKLESGPLDASAGEAIQDLYTRFAAGDESIYKQSCSPNLVAIQMASGQRFLGLRRNRAHMKAVNRAFPDLRIEVQMAIRVGDWAVAMLEMTGIHRGSLGPWLATGKTVKLHAADLIRYRGDQIVEVRSYASQPELAGQIAGKDAGEGEKTSP